jgi:excisionase family DNA binding protein
MALATLQRDVARWPDFPVDRLAARGSGRRALSLTRSPQERDVTHGRRSSTASAARKTILQAADKGRWKSRPAARPTLAQTGAPTLSDRSSNPARKDTAYSSEETGCSSDPARVAQCAMARPDKRHDHDSGNGALSGSRSTDTTSADPIDPRAFGLTKAAYAVGETLDLLSIGRTSLYAALKRGDLRHVKFGKKTLFYAADLAAFLVRLQRLSEEDVHRVGRVPGPSQGTERD